VLFAKYNYNYHVKEDVAHLGEKRNAYRTLVRKPEGKRRIEDLHVGGRIILKLILQK
jgi:hypothetical protein